MENTERTEKTAKGKGESKFHHGGTGTRRKNLARGKGKKQPRISQRTRIVQGKRQQQFPPQKHRENRRKAKAATATLFGGRRG